MLYKRGMHTHTKAHPTWLSLHGLGNKHVTNTTIVSLENIWTENYFKISRNVNMSHDENRGVTHRKWYVNTRNSAENSPIHCDLLMVKTESSTGDANTVYKFSTWVRVTQDDVTISCCPIAAVFCEQLQCFIRDITKSKCCESRASTTMRVEYIFINKDTRTISQKSKYFHTFISHHRSLRMFSVLIIHHWIISVFQN